MPQHDDYRTRRIRRNNWILLAVLVAFVLAIFANSFLHIGQEARPDSVPAGAQSRP
ncbi:MAG: hypothetical protein QHC90_19590 [Shinella sp.]|nr:hypothetical protein [Shinella sp.]